MAVSKYQSTQETTNIARIARIILGPCTDILRDVLREEMSPSALLHKFETYLAHSSKLKKPSINKFQQQLVWSGDYSNFDIVLLYLLLRNVCSIPPHSNQWGNIPSPGDRSVSANIERIRILRNETVHSVSIQLSNSEFEHKWKVIFQIVQELEEYLGSSEKYQESLMALKTCAMDLEVGYFYSKEFQYITSLENEVREGKEKLEKTEISISSLNIKAEDRDIGSKTEPNTDKTKDMENFEAKVLELEGCLGPSNEYQEFLMALNTRSMDPYEQTSISMKYQICNELQKEIEELEEELEKTKKSISTLDVKGQIPEFLQKHKQKPKSFQEHSGRIYGSKSKLADSTPESKEELAKIPEATIFRRKDDTAICMGQLMMESESDSESEKNVKTERTEPVTSKQLRELFNSLEIKIPHDPLNESFASGIVHKDVHNLVTTVNSLSHGVELPTNKPSNTVLIFEMEVVYDYDQLWVVKKDNSPRAFQNFLDGDSPSKVILITSKSLPIVQAKLTVYKKYKHVINEKKIFLQHEHEEFDDVAKLIAYQKVTEFCSSVESVKNAFSVDLYKIVTDYFGKPLTANKIREMCLEAFNESEHLRDLEDQRSFSPKKLPILLSHEKNWREWVATKIHLKISKKGEMECTDAWTDIWNACKKTVEDLGTILSGLEEFRTRVLPVDQNKEMDGWLKKEAIEDKASLHEYPSIIKCIVGQRDDKNVVKVYLSGDTKEETKEAFKQECKLENTDFEFVTIGRKKEMPEEIEKIKALEREAPAIDKSKVKELKRIIREHTDKLYARYSNIIGIRIGRRVHGDKLEEPCIIFYCLDKTLIPFGEKKIPESLAGWPCDVREKFIMFGMCTEDCRTITRDYPELGCSIGIQSNNECSGSAGFMYESKNSDKYRSGFLTASHIAIKDCHKLYKEKTLLSNHPLGNKTHVIVHPSLQDNGSVEHSVGEVVESFFGNYKTSEGLDFAAIKTYKIREGEKETVAIYNEDDGIAKGSVEVMKTGRTTGITFGILDETCESVRIYHPPDSKNGYDFKDIYVVENKLGEDFCRPGDSGSGVFVVEKTKEGDKPGKALGILIATVISEESYVCKIDRILDTLGLTIVRYK